MSNQLFRIPKKGDCNKEVKIIQEKLSRLGFDTKGIDYVFGIATEKAILTFQKSKNLTEKTGKLDIDTIQALGFELGQPYPYNLSFLENKTQENKLTIEQQIKFLGGMIQLCNNEVQVNRAKNEAHKEAPSIAECATTCSAFLQYAFTNAGLGTRANLFADQRNFYPTHNVEIMLFQLGFKYYPKNEFRSMKGAIGVMSRGSFPFKEPMENRTFDHTYHIYVILEEVNEKYDLKMDNGKYGVVYTEGNQKITTQGFWLPETIIPSKRNITEPTTAVTTQTIISSNTKIKISKIPIYVNPGREDRGMHVEILQKRLVELGFNPNGVDGIFGSGTKSALQKFQTSNGLPSTTIIDNRTLSLLNFEIETEFDSNPINAITSIVDKSMIINTFWTNGNRGYAPQGYYYGMALMFATLYDRLKKGEAIASELVKELASSEDKDALRKYNDVFEGLGMHNNSPSNRLRHLFVLMFGLGLMESNGKYCCGWDRAKENGWGGRGTPVSPKPENSEAGLFQTSYDIITSIGAPTRKTLEDIYANYKENQDGFFEYFSKGAKCSILDAENYGTGEGYKFQKLSKESPGFSVELTAVALRNISNHWGPIKSKGNRTYGLEIKKECNDLLLQVQHYMDDYEPENNFQGTGYKGQKITELVEELKAYSLNLADDLRQRAQLEHLFAFAPSSKANFWAIVDFNKPCNEKRFFIFDLRNKRVDSYYVSHGKKSGDLYAINFSNSIGSNQSSLGIYKTDKTYIGKNGRSLYLDGLQDSNNNAKRRYIVLHQADYVGDNEAGHSEGCFVVNPKYAKEVIDNLKEGSYILAWHENA
jgi:peptidoglycan hydrolase-like protein with peptidoglycan-binding domain